MTAIHTVSPNSRWTITLKGRLDLEHVDTCQCEIKMVGLLFECPECETVYGYTADSAMASYTWRRGRD